MDGRAVPRLAAADAHAGDEHDGGWSTATGWARIFGQPPRWFFHLVVAVPVLVLLWATSVPGGRILWGLLAAALLGVGALVWLCRSVFFLVAPQRRTRSWPWLVVSPLGAAIVVALLAADVPLKARFAHSRSAFEAVVAEVESAPGAELLDVPGFPRRLGTYDITSATSHGGAVIFVEAHGGFIDPTGFIHLPEGPTATDLQSPLGLLLGLDPLGGGWYTFTLHS